jgi:hypothetical protein
MSDDKIQITMHKETRQVIAALLDDNVPNERIFTSPGIWQEIVKLFPPALGARRVFTGDLDDNFDVESYLKWYDTDEEEA